ncbi:30S ribosome-binding factor RbfA [Rhodovibrio salinarum]|uniref:Ribosome-binding factor A n=1 Tax=Rhodovibrio salinarum TaxID=1087 RepID=A0A934QH60_9PROT|nr:30S ribosome-binding factor RbfA [Rhodovibrio salinarum]MBK1696784.1 30S ribosome-binding factor RbfA [Rhodovibrio salinarum]
MARQRAKAPSQRQLRVGEQLRHTLSQILARGDIRDPELADMNVTVTEVRVSPDMKAATAYVLPFADGTPEDLAAALNRAARYFRGQLGREIDLKYTPELRFAPDRSFDEAARVDALLRKPRVRQDLSDDPDAPGGPIDTGENTDSDLPDDPDRGA